MRLVFVHGWNVSDTSAYGNLPELLQKDLRLPLQIDFLYLTKYISFEDQLSLKDLSLAFELARRELLGDEPFACITHSTGALLIRQWIKDLDESKKTCPLTHLVMLAPANFGSALAQLGKSRVGRLLAWFDGKEPGQRVLDALELGSDETWELARHSYKYFSDSENLPFFPFVITGDKIDPNLYDCLNSYTAERASDGVIRTSAANLNSKFIKLVEGKENKLELQSSMPMDRFPYLILSQASHSGSKSGVVTGIGLNKSLRNVLIPSISKCLRVKSEESYEEINQHFKSNMAKKTRRIAAMLIVKVRDQHGQAINDFDLVFTAGANYSSDSLPKGFLLDRQKNSIHANAITFYFDYERMKKIPQGFFGFKVQARPSQGFVSFLPLEYQGGTNYVTELLTAHQTTLLEIVCKRSVDRATVRFATSDDKRESFLNDMPSGETF